MINLDAVKNDLINQIKDMDCEHFIAFADALVDWCEDVIDTDKLFRCEDCKHQYGECDEDSRSEICRKRYMEFYNDNVK